MLTKSEEIEGGKQTIYKPVWWFNLPGQIWGCEIREQAL